MNALPFISVEISQPGDKGDFLISVSDMKTRRVILANSLKEDRSAFEYLYNTRLIEGGGLKLAKFENEGDDAAKQDRLHDLMSYGQRLYQDLFGQDDALKRYMQMQPHFSGGACFLLRLYHTASELWNIPWEYMHNGTEFLGLNPRFPILRFLADTKFEASTSNLRDLPSPLRILFVISSPKNAQPLNIEAEINRIQRAVQPSIDKGLVELEFVEQGTLENLQSALEKREFHVLHYSGHGSMTSRGSLLVMEDEQGMSRPVFLDELLSVVSKATSLRLVFLSACKAGNIVETQAASGIAAGLMRLVPSVVAMQFSIRDDSATALAEAFYGQIGQGASLEEAMFVSRQAMYKRDPLMGDWGVPTLYVHRPHMRLLDASKERKVRSVAGRHDLSELPQPEPFIGRRDEQNELRKVVKDGDISFVYIWGMAGIGKSALIGQLIRRPGQDNVINDVLILRCDQIDVKQVFAQFQQWIFKHFPAVRGQLATIPQTPREFIKALSPLVKGIKLILVLDHVDTLMKRQEDRYWTFASPAVEEFFVGLARAQWSIVTIVTARCRWNYMAHLPENSFKDMHLTSLSITDVSFILTQMESFKNQQRDLLSQFSQLTGGHPATLDFVSQHLASKPQLLSDPRLPVSLAKYWHTTFLGQSLAPLAAEERELLKLMSVYDGMFSAQLVQIYGELETREQAAYIMIAWEILSLIDFIGTDNDDVPWYAMPSIVCTYLKSTMAEKEKQRLHARFADGLQEYLYHILEPSLDEADVDPRGPTIQQEFEIVLRYLPRIFQSPDIQTVQHYLELAFTWQKHCREAGMNEQANQIAVAFIEPLHEYGNIESTDELIRTVSESKTPSHALDLKIQYWKAVRLIDQRKYELALNVIETLERQPLNGPGLESLLANILECKGEVYRGMGDSKRSERCWTQAIDEYNRMRDLLGVVRVLLYFVEQTYYANNLKRTETNLEKAFDMLYKCPETGPAIHLEGKLTLFRGHIARLQNKGAQALTYYANVQRIGLRMGSGSLIAQGVEYMGYYYGLLKQYEIASKKLLQALDIYEKLNDQMGVSLVLLKLAVVQDFQGNGSDAYTFCQRSLRIAQELSLSHLKDVENLAKKLQRNHRHPERHQRSTD